MRLSIPQMAMMGRLLDEALPLDEAGRRQWLEKLSPEHMELAEVLRRALLPEAAEAAHLDAVATLPKLGASDAASDNAASQLKLGALVGPYELIRQLGTGGMAVVWLARRADGAFKREVALKLPMRTHLRADLEQRFARERDILASLEHPHIARFYDAGVDSNGWPYLSMEYIQGQPMTDWCNTHRLEISARLELFLQVLDALQYAHDKQVIHRDLKPSNILVTETGQVRLLDFGVAKLLEADETDQTPITSVYGRALTPDYASPELLRADPIDARSDIYSLGVLLYEMLTGVRPYRLQRAASIGMLEQAIATIDVERPSTRGKQDAITARVSMPEKFARQLRGDLDAITLKALAKKPAERYASATALAQDLRRYIDGKPIEALPARITNRLHKFVRRNKTMVGVSATAVAATLAAVALLIWGRAITPAAAEQSVAVMPFVNESSDKEQEYFTDGLTDTMIDLLSKVPDLRVPARSSSFFFKGKNEELSAIAVKLHVTHVLEGTVRRAGNRLRVSAELIRADTGYHAWSETYDRDANDIFKVQDEISAAVVAALKLKLVAAGTNSKVRGTANPEAYNEFLIGKHYMTQIPDADNFRRAGLALRKALALDPAYADASAKLVLADAYFAESTGDAAGLKRAIADAERLPLAHPDHGPSYRIRAGVRDSWARDWAGAQADFEKAIALDPADADTYYDEALMLLSQGLFRESITAAQKAVELDALDLSNLRVLAGGQMALRDYAAAEQTVSRMAEIDPRSEWLAITLSDLRLLQGRYGESLAACPKIAEERRRLACVARAQHSLGHRAEADQALADLRKAGTSGNRTNVAEVYAWFGDEDQAFAWFDQAVAARESQVQAILAKRTLDWLHNDPRWTALLKKMNLPS